MDDENKITIDITKPDDNYTTHIGGMTISPCPSMCTTDLNDTGTEFAYNTTYTSTDGYTITLPGLDDSLQDTWPAEYRVKEMIEKYPALKIQYEKFIEIYNLIKDDHKDDLDVI